MAFIMDPPTIEAEDDPTILCSTECPDANGQTWDWPSGTVCLAAFTITQPGPPECPSL